MINPLNLRLAAKELAFILADSETKVCFTDAFFAHVIDQVREEVGLEHVVMMGGATCRTTSTTKSCSPPATPKIPDEPDEDDPVDPHVHGRHDRHCPKGVLLDQRAEMLNLYHVALRVADRRERGVPAPDADVPRGVDGRHHRRSGRGRASSMIVPLFDPVGVMDSDRDSTA